MEDVRDLEITHIVVKAGNLSKLQAIREPIQWHFFPHVCAFFYSLADLNLSIENVGGKKFQEL